GGTAPDGCRRAPGQPTSGRARFRTGRPTAASRGGCRGGRIGKARGDPLANADATVVCVAGAGRNRPRARTDRATGPGPARLDRVDVAAGRPADTSPTLAGRRRFVEGTQTQPWRRTGRAGSGSAIERASAGGQSRPLVLGRIVFSRRIPGPIRLGRRLRLRSPRHLYSGRPLV